MDKKLKKVLSSMCLAVALSLITTTAYADVNTDLSVSKRKMIFADTIKEDDKTQSSDTESSRKTINNFFDDAVEDYIEKNSRALALKTSRTAVEATLNENLFDDEMLEKIENQIDEITEGKDSAIAIESIQSSSNAYANVTQKNFKFDNGDFYWVRRYDFTQTLEQSYYSSVAIPGNEISIRYIDYSQTVPVWVETSDLTNIKNEVLFISTDLYSMVLSPISVYSKSTDYETLEAVPKYEIPVVITKGDGKYNISMKFPQDDKYFAEVWAVQSTESLIDWSLNQDFLISQVFSKKFRWSMDGSYMITYTTYKPYTPNTYFKQTSNYPGTGLLKVGRSRFAYDMAYIMFKTSLKNMNQYGYYATASTSEWLNSDFGIGYYFYDTRFNTDFARMLVKAYNDYKDRDFLRAALMYAQFFKDFAGREKYVVEDPNGDEDKVGWLVPDYTYPGKHFKPHVSLNHAVAEVNYLLELYLSTGDISLLAYSEQILQGIRNTRDMWVMKDSNLEYGIYYSGFSTLSDYPVLTYNDLVDCQNLLYRVYGHYDEDLQFLMDAKVTWMNKNGVQHNTFIRKTQEIN